MKFKNLFLNFGVFAVLPFLVSCKVPTSDTVISSLEDRDYHLNVLFKEKVYFPIAKAGETVFIQKGQAYPSISNIDERDSYCAMKMTNVEIPYLAMLESYGVKSALLPQDLDWLNQPYPANFILTKKKDRVVFKLTFFTSTSEMEKSLPPMRIRSEFHGSLNCTKGIHFNDSIIDLTLGELRSIFKMRKVLKFP